MGDFVTFAKPWRFRPGTLAGVFPLPTLPPLVLLLVFSGPRAELLGLKTDDIVRDAVTAVAQTAPQGFSPKVEITVHRVPARHLHLVVQQVPGQANVRLAHGTQAARAVSHALKTTLRRVHPAMAALPDAAYLVRVASPEATVESLVWSQEGNMDAMAAPSNTGGKRDSRRSRRGTRPPASRFAREARAT